MAHTTRDWPRPASPATKTPSGRRREGRSGGLPHAGGTPGAGASAHGGVLTCGAAPPGDGDPSEGEVEVEGEGDGSPRAAKSASRAKLPRPSRVSPSCSASPQARSGPENPSASRTSPASSTRSVPGIGLLPAGSTAVRCRARTRPSASPSKCMVALEKTRGSVPWRPRASSWAWEIRYTCGCTSGQGSAPVRAGPGSGRMSSWTTDSAPCRRAVPRQSEPVSPPPTITTCRPSAVIAGVARSPSPTRLAQVR